MRFDGNDVTRSRALSPRAARASAMCRRGARFSRVLRFTTICAWAAPQQAGGEQETIDDVLEEFPRLEAAARSRRAARCRAASSNCWRSRAAFAAARALSCSTSRPRASSPRSSTRLSRSCCGCATSSGLTMILVEQNLDFIAALSQRILIIQKGTITRRSAAGRSRRRQSGRRIYRNHHLRPDCSGQYHRETKPWPSEDPLSISCAASPRTSACT